MSCAEQVCGRFQAQGLSHLPALKLRQGSDDEEGGFFAPAPLGVKLICLWWGYT
jgi:hypothetical protein